MRVVGSLVLRIGMVGIMLGCGPACSSQEKGLPAWSAVPTGPCAEGATRPCGVTLALSASAASCLTGEQTCHNGSWGSCENGSVNEKRLPAEGQAWGFAPGTTLQALSAVAACTGSPCDPTCQVYEEVPDGGYTTEGVPAGASWETGSLVDLIASNIPNGFIGKGISSNCKTAGDCQFDEYCALSGATNGCAHSKCTTGDPLNNLDATCDDSCVDKICAADATCCSSETTTCSHRKCKTGVALDPSCDTCVQQICATNASCCQAPCVVNTTARATATTGSCEAKVCAKNPSCCTSSGCGHDPCSTGVALAKASCGTAVQTVCTQRPECCTHGCGFDPCATNSSRMVAAGCTETPISTAIQATCASNPSCCWDSCSHSPFVSGGRGLATGCDSAGPNAVATVCAARSSCCLTNKSTNWTATCVDLYRDALIVQSGCSHNPKDTGTRLVIGCDSAGWNALDSLCNSSYGTNKSCCSSSGSWTSTCVTAYKNAVEAKFQTSWSSTCRDLYLSKLGALVGHTVSSSQCKWTSDCVADYEDTFPSGQTCQSYWSQACVDLVETECNVDCDNNKWSSACVGAVNSVCHQICADWTQSCVDKVASKCGSFCSSTGTCAHSRCLTGGPLDRGCDDCVRRICELDPGCCDTEWDTYCVVKVGSVCGTNCDQEVKSTGTCVPWMPNDKNEACTGIDLTAGVPCGEQVPVCNRGTQDLPPANALSDPPVPPLTIAAYTGNSRQMQDPCNVVPDSDTRYCTFDAGIPAGKCVNVSCACKSGDTECQQKDSVFDNLREVVVNPGQIDFPECSCDNNWSVYKKPSPNKGIDCSPPDCAAATTQASVAQVNMMFMFDKSGSMCWTPTDRRTTVCATPNAASRWALTTRDLKAFLQDGDSAALKVALRFYPDTVSGHDCSANTCDSAQCAVPQVDFLHPLQRAANNRSCNTSTTPRTCCANSADPQECELIAAITQKYPTGSTPTTPALAGAYEYVEGLAAASPFERWFVVLVTDGEPNDCSDGYSTVLPQMAQDAYRGYGIVTFTIGIENEVGATLLENIATSGGGQAFMVSTSDSASTEFLTALNTIRTTAAACEFPIDQSNPIDPENVRVQYTQSATGSVDELVRVDGGGSCGTGWYFDDFFNPTKITLCPDTCEVVRKDGGAKVTLALGCPMEYHPETKVQTYTATCPRGQGPQWGYLAYTATTPGPSTITFEVATGQDTALFTDPPTTPGVVAAVAHGPTGGYSTDTQACGMGAGQHPCPASLYTVLGAPAAFDPALQLRITLTPSGSASPTLTDWKVTYSCLDNV